MRLRHLEIFHAVMRAGSVSGAAELLHLSQSAASKALAQAEHALGLPLFHRVQGRLVHTREAEQLYGQTAALFAQVDQVRRLARHLQQNPDGQLRIGCLPSLGLGLIPGAVRTFRTRFPKVPLEVLTGNGDELLDRLLARELDLVVCFDVPLRPALTRLPLGDIRVVHLAPAGGDAAPDTPIPLASLDPQHGIGVGGSDPLAHAIRDAWEGSHAPEAAPLLETRTYSVAAALAREGLGFALVDEISARALGHDMRITPIAPAVSVRAVVFHATADVRSLAFDAFVGDLKAALPAP
ncbi:LysR family transcriptional regulator [Achromobacter sp. GG226]|uniref:LysR family transcriptional regulator n=1 Tax=Verticiella alkaliphila TaxID=2779529 RepID=UPI001C0B20E6|nr:LysR family transcriptional regulator [Verticiella sp. GG226]MBU4610428.1 LysR family transcriptional regulator [Verticiella sp. GG226]